ncbi:hypothetical protein KCP74_10615 [Salmonella enterica subsp. enterica]|nr:hypothetical protein KCP74_10615 [Salmonella enterica subsp. enterica]
MRCTGTWFAAGGIFLRRRHMKLDRTSTSISGYCVCPTQRKCFVTGKALKPTRTRGTTAFHPHRDSLAQLRLAAYRQALRRTPWRLSGRNRTR